MANLKWKLANDRQYASFRAYINACKAKPCADCKGSYPSYVMHFDHRDPTQKLFTIGGINGHISMARLQVEIDKCDVVCANCHAERTHKQKLTRLTKDMVTTNG